MKQPRIAVIGGGLRGIAAARAAAKSGCRTYLIESRQILGHELTATNHTWLHTNGVETPLQIGATRKKLLAAQINYGVQPLLASYAGGVTTSDGAVCGVLIANTYGTQLLDVDAVIDTEGTLFARPYEDLQRAEVHYAFTLRQVEPPFFTETTVDASIGLLNDQICVHADARPACVTVEFAFEANIPFEIRTAPQRLLPQAQRKAMQILDYLRTHYAVFAQAFPHEYMFQEVWLQSDAVLPQHTLPKDYIIMADPFATPLCTEALETMNEQIYTHVQEICHTIAQKSSGDTLQCGNIAIALSDCPITEFAGGGELGLRAITLPISKIPCREQTKVVLAGVGTAGTQTMRALIEKGVPFAAVETNTIAGGTYNVGLVTGYWHGYCGGLNAKLDRETIEYGSKYIKSAGPHRNSMSIMLQNELLQPFESHFYTSTLVCGVDVQNNVVQSLVCCDGNGLFTLRGEIFIDASGDGSAAVLAGAESMCGDPRDRSVQTFSQFGECNHQISSFLHHPNKDDIDIADVESYADMLRCMILSQRYTSDSDYSPMLTVRESRRIVGDYILNLADISRETPFADTLAVTDTPFDTHGNGSSFFCFMGLLKTIGNALRARIPYRCFLVRGLENMLITAKAFSATRDAASICRMNPDLRHAGYAVGLAAAQAILQSCSLRDIHIQVVQNELIEKGCLPDWTFQQAKSLSVQELIAQVSSDTPDLLRALYLQSSAIERDILIEQWHANPQDDIWLSLAAWHNDPQALSRAAARAAAIMDTPYTPAEPIYAVLCRHIAALAHAEKIDATSLVPLIERAESGGSATYCYNNKRYENTIYGFNRADCWRLPCHALLYLLAVAVERHADPALALPLEQLLHRPHMHGYITRNGTAPTAPTTCHNIAPAFCSTVELRLTAAAARCCSIWALQHLVDFVEDDRSVLRRFAVRELESITSQSFGENTTAWRLWIQNNSIADAVPCCEAITLL